MSRKSPKLSKKEMKEVALRMAEKQKWKELPGNRYTPEELKKMSEDLNKSDYKFHINKNIIISA